MLQIAPQMRLLVAIEPVDLRKGIDGLAELCREKLSADPFSGCLFIFRGRRATAIKLLQYDGQGFILAQKRLSKGRFVWWPSGDEPARSLEAYQAQLLVAAVIPIRRRLPCGAAWTRSDKKHSYPLAFHEEMVHTAAQWWNSSTEEGWSLPKTSFISGT
jgi:transposase